MLYTFLITSCDSSLVLLLVAAFMHRIGDVLESINGVELMDASHKDAVTAVKESRGLLDIVSWVLLLSLLVVML